MLLLQKSNARLKEFNQLKFIIMRKLIYLMLSLFMFAGTTSMAQEVSKKEERAERKAALSSEVSALVDSREYAFVVKTVLPLSLPPININPGAGGVIFGPEIVSSNLPFFGRAYGAASLDNDQGMVFSGAPENYQVKKRKKTYEVAMDVKTDSDSYGISLSISFDGAALLTISSSNRSDVSYSGNIAVIRKE